MHLLIYGGVTGGGGHPHLLVELITDRVGHINGGVCEGAQNYSEETRWETLTVI